MQWAIFFDIGKCVGCYSCVVACKLEHSLPPYPVHPPLGNPKGPELIRVIQVGPQIVDDRVHQHYQPISCMHCFDAPCIAVCPCCAIYKDVEMGIVLVNQNECTGCRSCLEVCPYGAPRFHDDHMILCDLCIHKLREGKPTACEAACPARAIHVDKVDEISTIAGEKTMELVGKAA